MYLVVSGGPPPPNNYELFSCQVISLHYFGQNGFPRDPMHPKNEYPKHWIWISLKRNGYTWY